MIYVGEINYLNVYPIYYYLKKEVKADPELNFLKFVCGTPAFLNNSLSVGNVDVSPSSSFYYVLNCKSSLIFRDISISSKKTIKSIYLFSQKPIEDFKKDEVIYVTPETLTSLNLLKVLLVEMYNIDIKRLNFITLPSSNKLELISTFNDNVMANKIFLHIGDNALRFKKSIPKSYFAYDLADLWYKFTGFPFVFAFFILRKEAYNNNKREMDIFYRYLLKSKRNAIRGFKDAALSILNDNKYNFISYEDLIDYWTNCLSFDFGEEDIKGFKLYCELLYKNRLISSIPALNFV